MDQLSDIIFFIEATLEEKYNGLESDVICC